MSILNVNQIQPVGSGQTVTINAANISAGSATLTAGTFSGNVTGNVTGTVNSTSGVTTVTQLNVGTGGTVITTTAGGLIGIGTINPAKKIHVQTSFVSGTPRGGGFTQALFESNQATASYWEFQANASSTNDILFSKSGAGGSSYGIIGYNHATDALRFFTNGDVKMTIDSSGRLTLPSQPSFMVHGATFNSTTPDIYLGSVVDHNVGNHFSTTTGLFTAPISGKYFFSFSFSTEDTNSHFVNLVKNGSTYPNNMLNYGVVYQPGTNTQIMNLTAGDTVSARRRGSGYAVYYAWFCGCLLG